MSSTNSVNPWSAAKRLLCYKPAQPVQSTPAVLPGLPTPAAPPSPLDALEAPQRSVAPRTRATWLDRASQGAGSGWTFLAMMSLVGAWAVAGVPMGASNTWQIIMEDFSSIQCYLWDITLLNTQRRDTAELAARLTDWQASNRDKLARLRHVLAEQLPVLPLPSNPDEVRVTVEDAAPIVPRRSRYDAAADRASEIAGSTLAQAVYIAGLIAWLGVGPSRQFNNTWQLDVNTAVAVELTIMTTFLQNTKRRHRQSTARTSDGIETADALLENRLRLSAPHVEVPAAPAVPERTRTRWQKIKDGGARAVEGYAHFMGSTGGVLLSAGAFATWIGLGKKLGYNNSNWWLIIGTYTGLVGFVDGFVLRNVQARASVALEEQFAALRVITPDAFALRKRGRSILVQK